MPLVRGATYDRLEGYNSLQWPMNEDGFDTPLLYTEQFHFPMVSEIVPIRIQCRI